MPESTNPRKNPDLPRVLVLETTSNLLKAGETYPVVGLDFAGGVFTPTLGLPNGDRVFFANGRWEWAVNEPVMRQLCRIADVCSRIDAAVHDENSWAGRAEFASALKAFRDHVQNLAVLAHPLKYPLYEGRVDPRTAKMGVYDAATLLSRLRGALLAARTSAQAGTVLDASLACWAVVAMVDRCLDDLVGPTPAEPAERVAEIRRLHQEVEDLKARVCRATEGLAQAKTILDGVMAQRDRLASENREMRAQVESIAAVVRLPLESLLGGRLVPVPVDVLTDVAVGLKQAARGNPTLLPAATRRLAQFFPGAREEMPR